MTGHEECVQMLLEQEVSILCKDSRGRTPLHFAAARGHATWLSELLQMALSEEDCSWKDNHGYTPLHWACYNGKLPLLQSSNVDLVLETQEKVTSRMWSFKMWTVVFSFPFCPLYYLQEISTFTLSVRRQGD